MPSVVGGTDLPECSEKPPAASRTGHHDPWHRALKAQLRLKGSGGSYLIITITSPHTATGTTFSFQVTTTGFPAPKLTKTGTLPAG